MALIIFCRSPVLPVLSNIGAIVVDGKVDGGAGGQAASGATGGAAGGATGGPTGGSPGPAPTGYHNQVAPPHSAVVALQQVAMHQVLLIVERTHPLLICYRLSIIRHIKLNFFLSQLITLSPPPPLTCEAIYGWLLCGIYTMSSSFLC